MMGQGTVTLLPSIWRDVYAPVHGKVLSEHNTYIGSRDVCAPVHGKVLSDHNT